MAVAHIGASEAHTGTTGSANEASFSWTHTPGGTPRGVTVAVWTNGNAGVTEAVSVTYGGVTVPAVSGGEASDTVGESGNCKIYHLGSNIPTGDQTVVVTRNNTAIVMSAQCVTQSAAGDTAIYLPGIVLVTGDDAVTEASVTDGSPGTNSQRYAFGHFGHQTPPADGANSTITNVLDTGAQCFRGVFETTAGQGSRAVGMSSATADDRAIVHFAVFEARSPAVAALTLAGTITALAFGLSMGAASLVFAGLAPTVVVDSPNNTTIEVPAGSLVFKGPARPLAIAQPDPAALTLVGYAPTLAHTVPIASGALAVSGTSLDLAHTLPIAPASLTLQGTSVAFDQTFPIGVASLIVTGPAPAVSEGGSPATISPDPASLTLAGQIPTLSIGQTIAIPAGSLIFKGPARLTSFTIPIGAASLTLDGQAPTVQITGGTVTIPIGVGTLTLTGQTPVLLNSKTIAIPAGTLTLTGQYLGQIFGGLEPATLVLTGYAPTLQISGQTTIAIGVGSLTLTGQVPAAFVQHVASPAPGTLTLTGQVPVLAHGIPIGIASLTLQGTTSGLAHGIPVGVGTLTLTGQTPAMAGSTVIAIPVGTLTLAGTETVLAWTVPLPAGSLSLTGYEPTVAFFGQTVIPIPAGALVLTGQSPAAFQQHLAAIGTAALNLTGQAPILSHTLPVGVASLTLTGQAPTLVVPVAIEVPSGALALEGQSVSTGGTATIVIPAGSIALAGDAPALHLVVPIQSGVLALQGYGHSQHLTVALPVGSLTLTGAAPSVGGLGQVRFTVAVPLRKTYAVTVVSTDTYTVSRIP